MMKVQFNGGIVTIAPLEQLGAALDEYDLISEFELWMSAEPFPSMGMFRNGKHAWLMHMMSEGDSAHSVGTHVEDGVGNFRLANRQIDEYPLSWCIEVEQCYKAISYFYVNQGAAPAWINWS